MKLGTQVLPTYRVFSLEELKEATKNFEHSAYLGEGSIGKVLIYEPLNISLKLISLTKTVHIKQFIMA